MQFNEMFKPAPLVRPMLNIGSLFDIPTGRYQKGINGEMILNGGLSYVTGIGGMGNTFKSTIAHHMSLASLSRYTDSYCNVYDTEISLTMERLNNLCQTMPVIGAGQLEETGRMILTDKTIQTGNDWWETFKNFTKQKRLDSKKQMLETPFADKDGKPIKAMRPDIFEIDSLSQMDIESVLAMHEKNEIGSSGLNMEAMKSAAAKSQMLNQLPGITGSAGAYVIMTAHIGEEHQLDPYSPPKKKLGYLKGKLKLKNVPEKFTFLTNNCWYMLSSKPYQNASTKGAEYPRDSNDVVPGDTDLNVVQLLNLRGKSGSSGMPFELLVSQSEGLLPSLSEFHFIKNMKRFGLGGNDRNYFLELVPDISLQRTTVRSKINESEKLRRALEITSELGQITWMWSNIDRSLLCTPQELFEDIKKQGYDWDEILEGTRGYWIFNNQENDKKFLSTMDLLRMRKGEYKPFWM